ncbi:ferritin-like domain-containing protein [Candidatus Electronema sp. PJ]|uniref:ferritin-like domain-containing protein n=1 Tax=Candidatus Electronema sp. PJ TaxID=3401572 RepID=UPI003AA85166
MIHPDTPKIWTKQLVQEHAQAAAAIELYTLPFYLTAMTSVKDTGHEACRIIFSVAVEEMLHLQLAANLCAALDTEPNFKPPQYGSDIPYIKPYDPETGERGFLNAVLGPLNDETLNTMLDIENPEEIPSAPFGQALDHSTPQYPYSSIGEMYDGLMVGIKQIGVEQFSWTTQHQQAHWPTQMFPQIIANYADARNAVQAVTNQGEGHIIDSVLQSPPWTEKNFPIPPFYRLMNDPNDPEPYNGYSHFGRFLKLKTDSLPAVFTGVEGPADPVNKLLQQNFLQLLLLLETLWTNGGVNFGGSAVLWSAVHNVAKQLVNNARACWKAGVIPNWFDFAPLAEDGRKGWQATV